ncbi:hypothetical protein CLM62_20065 [Streptomyces sp. SA15]|nr:hypothetical protein CLM62_20065 [Streptomyces sp. SA15]
MRRLVGPVILFSSQGGNDGGNTVRPLVSSHRISQLDVPIPAALGFFRRSDLVIILHKVTALDDLDNPVRRHSHLISFRTMLRVLLRSPLLKSLVIKELLGHVHIGVTATVYPHVRLRLQRDAIDLLGRVLDQP